MPRKGDQSHRIAKNTILRLQRKLQSKDREIDSLKSLWDKDVLDWSSPAYYTTTQVLRHDRTGPKHILITIHDI